MFQFYNRQTIDSMSFLQDYLEHYLEDKRVNIFQFLSFMSSGGVKPNAYVIIFTERRLKRCITIVGLNAVWKSHEMWDHDIVLGYLGSYVFVPTEKAYGKCGECAKLE